MTLPQIISNYFWKLCFKGDNFFVTETYQLIDTYVITGD